MRFILAILFALGLIVVIFILIFRGGGDEQQAAQRVDLNRYINTDATIQLDVDGPVVANQTHDAYRITVNRQQVTMQVYGGYQKQVVAAQSYPNNQESYANLVKSLSILGYTDINTESSFGNDERGYCPSGNRFNYRLVENGREIVRGWNTSCGRQGNFNGNAAEIRGLLRQQVPDSGELLRGTGL